MLSRLKFQIEPLVNEMLDQIPQDILIYGTVLDPAMGGGQFVKEVERRKRVAGLTDEQIKATTFGIERNILCRNYAVNKNKLVGTYDIGNFLEMENEMEFDVIIGNPPYNSNDTSREKTNHRGQGDNLAKKFTIKALELAPDYLFLIMPYGHRTYSPALQKLYKKHGLYKIEPCMQHFGQVSTNPCTFYFDTSKIVNHVDDQYNNHTLSIPKNNIGQLFRNQPGKLNRIDYESSLLDSGEHQIVVTTNIIKFTNQQQLADDMNDTTIGHWRVVFNCTTSVGKLGKVIIANPTAILSKSVHCLIMKSEQEAIEMQQYLDSDAVKKILTQVKLNCCNSKKFLQYIPR